MVQQLRRVNPVMDIVIHLVCIWVGIGIGITGAFLSRMVNSEDHCYQCVLRHEKDKDDGK